MQPVFRAHAQSIFANYLRDFCYRAGGLEPQVADNNESFIDQHACTFFQPRERYARIDIAIIIGAPNDNVRCLLRSGAEKSADPVRRRSHFFNDFLELLDYPPRFNHRLLLIENLRAQLQEFTPKRIARRQCSDHVIECLKKTFPAGVSFPSLQSLTSLFAHLVWVNPPNRIKYTVIRRVRNVRRCASAKCSTAKFIILLRKSDDRIVFAQSNDSEFQYD